MELAGPPKRRESPAPAQAVFTSGRLGPALGEVLARFGIERIAAVEAGRETEITPPTFLQPLVRRFSTCPQDLRLGELSAEGFFGRGLLWLY